MDPRARVAQFLTTVGNVNVSDSIFISNQSQFSLGGAIASYGGSLSVTGSTFFNNLGYYGGALAGAGGTLNVTNCTFFENVGTYGAVIYNGGTLNLSNSTITANTSLFGALYNENPRLANVKSTIIAGNHGGNNIRGVTPDVNGTFGSKGFNLIGKKDGSTGFIAATDKKGTVKAPLEAKLDPLGLRSNGGPTQTVALLPDSPAIDSGSSASLIAGTISTDQRGTGFPRTVDKPTIVNAAGGDGTDIGAYEAQ